MKKQQEQLFQNHRVYCVICNADTRLATDEELSYYKRLDTTYKLDFLHVPTCDCYLQHDEWMEMEEKN